MPHVSAIPPSATEVVVERYADGSKKHAEYRCHERLLGRRAFFPGGAIEMEVPYRDGTIHGIVCRWLEPGVLLSKEPFEGGLAHGTAHQYARDGRIIGRYTLDRGTGTDRWYQERPDGSIVLAEIRHYLDGIPHGVERWLDPDGSIWHEWSWNHGEYHGVERMWNSKGRIRRGYPKYWIAGRRARKRDYLRATRRDPTLPAYRGEDDRPVRFLGV